MEDRPADLGLDDDTGPLYREGYNLARARIESAGVRTFRRDPAAQLAQLRARVARDLGDAGRMAVEAIDAGVEDAEAGRRPAW